MPLRFDMNEEEKEKAAAYRDAVYNIRNAITEKFENNLESYGGMFLGVNDKDGIVFGMKEKDFEDFSNSLFKEEKK
jgi:hypothetical protein